MGLHLQHLAQGLQLMHPAKRRGRRSLPDYRRKDSPSILCYIFPPGPVSKIKFLFIFEL